MKRTAIFNSTDRNLELIVKLWSQWAYTLRQ